MVRFLPSFPSRGASTAQWTDGDSRAAVPEAREGWRRCLGGDGQRPFRGYPGLRPRSRRPACVHRHGPSTWCLTQQTPQKCVLNEGVDEGEGRREESTTVSPAQPLPAALPPVEGAEPSAGTSLLTFAIFLRPAIAATLACQLFLSPPQSLGLKEAERRCGMPSPAMPVTQAAWCRGRSCSWPHSLAGSGVACMEQGSC